MGNDGNIVAFHPTEKSKPLSKKSTKLSSGDTLSRNNIEDNISDDEMEDDYRTLLVRKNENLENTESSMYAFCSVL